jgi:hypothetical protein
VKRIKKTLFKIIFFLIVLFSIGINAYSTSLQVCKVEIPAGTNNVENSFYSENDPIDEDQIYLSYKFGIREESACQISIRQNCSLLYVFCSSVWQPPKTF